MILTDEEKSLNFVETIGVPQVERTSQKGVKIKCVSNENTKNFN